RCLSDWSSDVCSSDLREAAVEALQQARAKPLTPQVNVAYTGGGFGGGRNNFIGDYSSRGDGEASLVWRFDNLGFGNAARIREQQIGRASCREREEMQV